MPIAYPLMMLPYNRRLGGGRGPPVDVWRRS